MNKPIPKVSVVMSVYNGAHYLQRSVESILKQTFTDFEFIIIDDGSTDDTWRILSDYTKRDPRIKPFKNLENLGLTKTLNKGLKLAQGEYIARQDADDVSLPERLEKQISYMESHQSVALVSTGVQYVDDKSNKIETYIPPEDPILLRWRFLFENPLRHSTVLWRRELVACQVGSYDPSFTCTQDYDLWVRIGENSLIGTLPLVLVEMRWHKESISITKMKIQDALAAKVTYRQVTRYLPNESLEEEDIANLRVMPQRKDSLPKWQYFLNSLSASGLKQAVYRYWRLWEQFCVINGVIKNSQTFQALQQEVEQSLVEVLGLCKLKSWILLGGELLLSYLLHYPSRTLAVTLTILRKLLSSTGNFQTHRSKKL